MRLHRLGPLLASLGAAQGDSLCLEPAGPLAVRASLVRASGEEEAEEAAGEQGQEGWQVEDEGEEPSQHEQLPSGRSALGAAAFGSGSAAASLPNPAPSQQGLWRAVDQLLAALETQGGVAPSLTASCRAAFASLPSHAWRQAHVSNLSGSVDSSDWQGAAAWLAAQC